MKKAIISKSKLGHEPRANWSESRKIDQAGWYYRLLRRIFCLLSLQLTRDQNTLKALRTVILATVKGTLSQARTDHFSVIATLVLHTNHKR